MSWKLGIVHILTLVAIFMGEDVACPINCHGAVNVVHERCTKPTKKFTNFSFSIPLYLSTYSFISSSFLPYFSIDFAPQMKIRFLTIEERACIVGMHQGVAKGVEIIAALVHPKSIGRTVLGSKTNPYGYYK
jgi:hypothetical protein